MTSPEAAKVLLTQHCQKKCTLALFFRQSFGWDGLGKIVKGAAVQLLELF